jgi:hypothetical protein
VLSFHEAKCPGADGNSLRAKGERRTTDAATIRTAVGGVAPAATKTMMHS